MIDWSKLKPYERTRSLSFEQLCYQTAKGLYEDRGTFTAIDDSGGGSGVEFYLTLPNGDQWGWQAKFFYPNKRLRESSRKTQIITSLKRSCQMHPLLKKWFLCTPTDFTPKEQSWFDGTLPQKVPDDIEVELIHWGDSDFNNWLSRPKFAGKLNYFFGELELNLEWFKNQVETQTAIIKDKFDPLLHIETFIDKKIDNLTVDEAFITEFTKDLKTFQNILEEVNLVNEINNPLFSLFNWDDAKLEIDSIAQDIQEFIKNLIEDIDGLCSLLDNRQIKEIRDFDLDTKYQLMDEFYRNLREQIEIDFSTLEFTGDEDNKNNTIEEAEKIKDTTISILINLIDHLYIANLRLKTAETSELHILGIAGTGKTHIVSHICNKRIRAGIPALLVLGNNFNSTRPLREQLLRILDIPATYSWNDFLHSLSAAAEAYQTCIPLVIDGLNETTRNGVFSNIWRNELQGLIQELSEVKNIVIITTCRSSYVNAIWDDNKPSNSVQVTGFEDYNINEAIKKYFDHYKIKADIKLLPLTQFKHPIYLKIFCESKNPSKEEEVEIYIGQETLFEVFDEFLRTRNRIICDRLGLYSTTQLLNPILNEIASYFWENHCRSLPLKKLVELTDGQPLEKLSWNSSRAKAILDEGLLVFREMGEDDEVINFTYDLLGGYFIAQYLIQKNQDQIEEFIQSEKAANMLFSNNFETLHPLYEDIRRSLATLLPVKVNKYLQDVSDKPYAINLSIKALFEINPEAINQNCIDFISTQFENIEVRELLLKLAISTITSINHPFNANFWSGKLKDLSMTERDIIWTEFIRKNSDFLNRLVEYFKKVCLKNEPFSEITKNRLHLLAEYIMWMLTSTLRKFRDRVTRALYHYGRRFPNEFLDLVLFSLDINDCYIPERMLAATYGIMMARQYEFDDSSFRETIMLRYGRELFNEIFSENAPHSTTHILARDYAKHSIDITLIHHPDFLTTEEQQRITPPFPEGGIREWGESEDRNEGAYRDGNAPIQMDFGNYTLGRLVRNRNNYDYDHPQYVLVKRNIFWRLYDLGYSLDIFEEIDKSIARYNFYSEEKIDRYGKKYSWIAFYELAGFRQDQGLLSKFYDDEPRISDADLDPSFPLKLQEFNLVKDDYLGNRSISVKDWILKSNFPNIKPCLMVNEIRGELGPWILLDGLINQEDLEIKRCCFIFFQGFIVKETEAELVKETLDLYNFTIQLVDIPEDYYTYAGEIPWCDTYPLNTEDEPIIYLEKNKNLCGLIPVRRYNWESYHNALNLVGNVRTIAKQIAEHFGLCGQPQTFDLFEKNGKRASITFRNGDEFGSRQEFIFIRKDLLEHYLKATKSDFVWVIWGQREFKSSDITERDLFAKENEYFKRFQEVKIFKNLQKLESQKKKVAKRTTSTKKKATGKKIARTKSAKKRAN